MFGKKLLPSIYHPLPNIITDIRESEINSMGDRRDAPSMDFAVSKMRSNTFTGHISGTYNIPKYNEDTGTLEYHRANHYHKDTTGNNLLKDSNMIITIEDTPESAEDLHGKFEKIGLYFYYNIFLADKIRVIFDRTSAFDGYINITTLCRKYKKTVNNWLKSKRGKQELIRVLEKMRMHIHPTFLEKEMKKIMIGHNDIKGTYINPLILPGIVKWICNFDIDEEEWNHRYFNYLSKNTFYFPKASRSHFPSFDKLLHNIATQ